MCINQIPLPNQSSFVPKMFEEIMQEFQLLTSFGIKCSSKSYDIFIECVEDVSPLLTALKMSSYYISLQNPSGKEVMKLDFKNSRKVAMLHPECGLMAKMEKVSTEKLSRKEKSPYIDSEAKYLIYSPPEAVRYEVQHLVTTTRKETHILEITTEYCVDSEGSTTKLVASIIISKSEYVTVHVDESLSPYEKVLIIGAAISFMEIFNRSFMRKYRSFLSILLMFAALLAALAAIAGIIYYCAYHYCRDVRRWCGVGDYMTPPVRLPGSAHGTAMGGGSMGSAF